MSLDGMLSRFSNLNCDSAEHRPHIMKLEFPAGSLLPDDCHLYLEPPKDVAHRCEPPDDRRISGLLDLDFPVVLRPNAANLTSGTSPHQVLLDAVMDLPRLRGSSVLGVASYFDDITNQVVYLYRLAATSSSGFSSSRYYKLDANESCQLLKFVKVHEWISLLQHLVSRSSEHAYYHVRKQLNDQYGLESALEEERGWEISWSDLQGSSLKEALSIRMRSIRPQHVVYERDGLRMRLPCGHMLDISTANFERMSGDECRALRCPDCQAPVLWADDIHGAEVEIESFKCAKQKHENKHWATLDRVPDDYTRQFNGKSLAAALRAALDGFTISWLISPAPLCFAASQSTQGIMQHFESFLSGNDIQVCEKPERLVEMLIQHALETATGEDDEPLSKSFVPPAYVKFLYAWLCRAVNFLCDRQCNEMKASHLGIHRHELAPMYNPALWESDNASEQSSVEGSETDEDTEAAMNDLNAEMGEMDLLGISALTGLLDSMDIGMEQKNRSKRRSCNVA